MVILLEYYNITLPEKQVFMYNWLKKYQTDVYLIMKPALFTKWESCCIINAEHKDRL
jgi:hypothetical protein